MQEFCDIEPTIAKSRWVNEPPLYGNDFSEKGHSPNPSHSGRVNASYISLQNAANRLHEKETVCSTERVTSLAPNWRTLLFEKREKELQDRCIKRTRCFLDISLPSLHDHDLKIKCLFSRIVEDIKQPFIFSICAFSIIYLVCPFCSLSKPCHDRDFRKRPGDFRRLPNFAEN